MRVYNYTYGKKTDGSRVIALGLFDGVHLGHRALIDAARGLARRLGTHLSVFTFSSEDALLKGGARIYSTERKLEILESLDVDEVIITDFSSVSEISAADFVRSVSVDMGAVAAVCGRDFRFGKGALGNTELLASLGRELSFETLVVDDVLANGEKISTGRIKELLGKGRIKEANELLSSPASFTFKVLHGDGRGNSLGYPTVNAECTGFCALLPHGVYRTEVEISGKRYTGMTNLGTCPTFPERKAHIETYILDYSGNLYEREITISFLDFIRPERKFKTSEDLVLQIDKDVEKLRFMRE